MAHLGEDALDLLHLLRVGRGKHAALYEKAVFKAHPDMAAKQGGLR